MRKFPSPSQLQDLSYKARMAGLQKPIPCDHQRPARVRLAELNPRLKAGGEILVFDCPACCCERAHAIRIPLGSTWQASGECPDQFTVAPSINAGCWHGHIRNGEVVST